MCERECEREEYSILNIKNTRHQKQHHQLRIIKPYAKHREYTWNNRYHGFHKDRKEVQTYEYLEK
jgi:hypothetical protein